MTEPTYVKRAPSELELLCKAERLTTLLVVDPRTTDRATVAYDLEGKERRVKYYEPIGSVQYKGKQLYRAGLLQ